MVSVVLFPSAVGYEEGPNPPKKLLRVLLTEMVHSGAFS